MFQVLDAHMKSHKVMLTHHCRMKSIRGKKELRCNFMTRMRNIFQLHTHSHRARKLVHKYKVNRSNSSNSNSPTRKKMAVIRRRKQNIHPIMRRQVLPKQQVDKLLKCGTCDYATLNKARMSKHVQRHTDTELPCPEYLVSKGGVPEHVNPDPTHGDLQTYKCEQCDFRTRHKNALYTHMHTHSRDRPYKCHICDYSAIQKVHLDAHMYKHDGVLPFQCSLCKYKTATKASLKAHMCRHTGVKPFKCDFCEYRSARKADLKKHVSIKHKEEFKVLHGTGGNARN